VTPKRQPLDEEPRGATVGSSLAFAALRHKVMPCAPVVRQWLARSSGLQRYKLVWGHHATATGTGSGVRADEVLLRRSTVIDDLLHRPLHHCQSKERIMKRTVTLCLVLAIAVALPTLASAHGRYQDSAYKTEKNIERKFPRVSAAVCGPLPQWARAQYGAYSEVRGTVRTWNHFYCGVAIVDGSTCLAVAHMTGPSWYQFILSSWQGAGCSSRQLRG